MKRLLIVLTIFVAGHSAFSQTYYTPVWTGNGLDHMNIYITSVTVNGVSVVPGSEIGVFDGEICVGAAVRPNVIENFIEVRVSKNDPTTTDIDGYTPGNPISFRIFDLGLGTEHLDVRATYSSGSSVFEPGGTAVVALKVSVNRKPVAVTSQSKIVNEGDNVTVSGANSYDPDGDQLTYSWTVTPSIADIDFTLPTLSFIAPEVHENTNFNFTLVVNDGELDSDPAFVSVYVRDVNKPPVITGQLPIETDENQPITLTIDMVEFTDPDPEQTHTLLVYPGNNYMLSGSTITPVPYFSGLLSVPVRVSDGIDLSNTYNLEVTVNSVNNPPRFTSTPVLSVVEGLTYLYHIKATDSDGDELTIGAEEIPGWLSLDAGEENGSAILAGIPQTADVGTHPVKLSVTDGIIETPIYQDFNVSVQAASLAPALITSALNDAYENSSYTSLLEFYDSDSDSVIVSLQNQPEWLGLEGEVNGKARLKLVDQHAEVNLVGTPPAESVGTFGLTILFTDKENNRSRILPLSVYAQNTPPVASDVEFVTNENESVLVVLQGTDAETPYGLIYELLSQPEHGTLEQLSQRIFIYTPDPHYFGDDEFDYRVKESGTDPLHDDAKVYINVDFVNDPPVIFAENRHFYTIEEEPVVAEGVEYNDDLDGEYAEDLELATIYGPFYGTFNLDELIYTPDVGFYGSDLVYVVARELGEGGLESEPLMLWFHVEMVNQYPLVSIREIILDEDTQVSFIPVVSDREEDIEHIEYNIILEPSNGTLIVEDLAFTYIPDADWNGTDYVVFQAKDYHGDWTPDLELDLHVVPVNDSPVATSDEVDAQGASNVVIDFTDLVSDIDNPHSELTIEFLVTDDEGVGMGLQPSTIVQSGSNMTFVYTSLHDSDQDHIPYRVYDLSSTSLPEMITINNLSGTKAKIKSDIFQAKGDYLDITWGDTLEVVFTLVVGGSNTTTPDLVITNLDELNGQLFDIELLYFEEGYPLVTYRGTYVAPTIFDEDGKPSGNATEVIFDDVGFKGSKKTKEGEEESNESSVSIGNLGTKVPTIIHPIVPQNITEGELAKVDILYTDPDTPGDEITWGVDTGLEGASYDFELIDEGKVSLELTPPIDFYGSMVVSVSATDDTTTTYREFMLMVEGVNNPPQIRMADSLFFLRNTQRIVSALITDRETAANQLDISFVADPENAAEQILYSQGDLTITPTQGFSSDFYVNVSASDGQDTTTHQLKLKYKATNAMPMLAPISKVVTLEDIPVSINFTPTDPDPEDILTVTVESSNKGLVADDGISVSPDVALQGVERTLTVTPNANRYGLTEITVYVSDGFKSIAQQFTLEVLPVNDSPVLTPIDDQEMYNNEELTLVLSATDIDSYIFTFSAESDNSNLVFDIVENMLTISVLNDYVGETGFVVTVADDSLATDSQVVEIIIHEATSAPVIDGMQILVFPNPTRDIINIRGINREDAVVWLSLYNVYGQLVQARKIQGVTNGTAQVDLGNLPQGVYVLKVQVNNYQYTTRIVKQ